MGKFDNAKGYPISKKDDLLSFFSSYDVSEHTNQSEQCNHLEDGDLMLVVHNPYRKETLDIILSSEILLFFAGWHGHYDIADYDKMKQDIKGILEGKKGIFKLSIGEEWLGSTLYEGDHSHFTDEKELLKSTWKHQETIERMATFGGSIDIIYWKPSDTYLFEVAREDEEPIRKFPRRSTVRFVMEKGQSIGSGGYKKYDEETAYIHYMYIEPNDETDIKPIYKELYYVLENDIKNADLKTIIVLTDSEDDVEFYCELGFVMCAIEFDREKITKMDSGVCFEYKYALKKELCTQEGNYGKRG